MRETDLAQILGLPPTGGGGIHDHTGTTPHAAAGVDGEDRSASNLDHDQASDGSDSSDTGPDAVRSDAGSDAAGS